MSKYSKRTSSNGKTATPSRRDGKYADFIRGGSKSGSFKWSSGRRK